MKKIFKIMLFATASLSSFPTLTHGMEMSEDVNLVKETLDLHKRYTDAQEKIHIVDHIKIDEDFA
jgi:hypothetical protein